MTLICYKDANGTISFVRPGEECLEIGADAWRVDVADNLCEVHEANYIGNLRCGFSLPCPIHGSPDE